mmetsp:Transcript_104626/g.233581  ORF Transcript_104626/g.233581 Transcript_104626/m.233581 type:complete len:171 (+) Transcript_104626:184-696(+)
MGLRHAGAIWRAWAHTADAAITAIVARDAPAGTQGQRAARAGLHAGAAKQSARAWTHVRNAGIQEQPARLAAVVARNAGCQGPALRTSTLGPGWRRPGRRLGRRRRAAAASAQLAPNARTWGDAAARALEIFAASLCAADALSRLSLDLTGFAYVGMSPSSGDSAYYDKS